MASATDDLGGDLGGGIPANRARALIEAIRRIRTALELFDKTEAERIAKQAYDRARQFARNPDQLQQLRDVLFGNNGIDAPADLPGDVINSGRRDP